MDPPELFLGGSKFNVTGAYRIRVHMARRLGPSQSPVVPATMNKKLGETRAESAFNWGASCLLGAALIGADMLSICTHCTFHTLNINNYTNFVKLVVAKQGSRTSGEHWR